MNTSTHFEVDDKGDFELSKAKVLQDLLRCSSFVDVTLVNDDADQFGVHKLVLSTVSPVLRKIFEKNPQDHPLLFMRGVNSRQLEALVKFIYTGEASVNVNELNDFISLGTDLKITGLLSEQHQGNFEKSVSVRKVRSPVKKKPKEDPIPPRTIPLHTDEGVKVEAMDITDSYAVPLDPIEEDQPEEYEENYLDATPDQNIAAESDTTITEDTETKSNIVNDQVNKILSGYYFIKRQEMVDSMILPLNKDAENAHKSARIWSCSQCGKVMSKCHLREHVEMHKFALREIVCPLCDKTFKRLRYVKPHLAICIADNRKKG